MTFGMLVATGAVSGQCPMTGMSGCCGAAAIVLVTAAALSYFFMKLGMQAAAAQAAALCFFGFHALHEASAATACKYVLCEIEQRAAAASAAALHLFGFHAFLERLQQERASISSVSSDSARQLHQQPRSLARVLRFCW